MPRYSSDDLTLLLVAGQLGPSQLLELPQHDDSRAHTEQALKLKAEGATASALNLLDSSASAEATGEFTTSALKLGQFRSLWILQVSAVLA